MKKKLLIALMAITAAFSGAFGFAACGDDAGNGGDGGNGGNGGNTEQGGNTEHKHTLTLVEEKKATCIAEGNSAYYVCGGCGKWFSDKDGKNEITDKTSVVLEKTDHNYVDNVCSVCHEHKPTDGLLYTDMGAYYEVGGIGTATDTDIVVAKEYKGKPVTAIGRSAFVECEKLTSVIIPDSVTAIKEHAFMDCIGIESITVPDSVAYIGDSAFDCCDNLQYNEYENGLYLGNSDNPYAILVQVKDTEITSCTINENTKIICDSVFWECADLESVTIPDSIVSFAGFGAFDDCEKLQYNEYDNALYLGNSNNPYLVLIKAKDETVTSCTVHASTKFIYGLAFTECSELLTSVTIPEGLTYIGYGAFGYCSGLESITLPKSLTYIGETAFYGCGGIKSVTIPSGVTFVEECAFGMCNSLENVVIENGVSYIARQMFTDCRNLKNVTLPDSVTYIEDNAFWNCISLISLNIPDSVTYIEEYVFFKCAGIIKNENGIEYVDNWIVGFGDSPITVKSNTRGIAKFSYNKSEYTIITFEGTKEQWNAISKDCWVNENSADYTIQCTDGDIEKVASE